MSQLIVQESSTSLPVTPQRVTQKNNSSSPQKHGKPTNSTSGFVGRSKKKQNVKASAPVRCAPAKVYLSSCCQLPARKPACGQRTAEQNPENKKTMEVAKGLGKWICQCGKKCSVMPSKSGVTVEPK